MKLGIASSSPRGQEEKNPLHEDGNWALIRWMLGLCWRERRLFTMALVLQVLLAAASVLGLNLIGLGIDYLTGQLGVAGSEPRWPLGMAPPAEWTALQVVGVIAAAAVVAALATGVLQYGAARSIALLVHGRLVPRLQRQVFAKLQEVCMRFYARNSSGSVINRATGDVQAVRSFVDLALMEAVTLTITFAVYAAYMFGIHPALTIACLAVAPAMAVASAIFSKVTRPMFLRYRESFDNMILYLSETIRGAPVVKGFSLEGKVKDKMLGMNADLWERQKSIFFSISLFSPSVNMLNHIGMFVLLLYGGALVIQGELPLGTGLVVFAGLLQQYSNRISNVAQIANALQESLTGARRLRDILSTHSSLAPAAEPLAPKVFRGRVDFADVSMSYEGGRKALSQISFTALPGETIALVGATGSGKTALLNLIPRLCDPDTGCVRIDGIDTRDYDIGYLRRQIGVVFQDSFLFNASISDNIRFGREEASDEAVRRAAEIAQASPFVEELENGYETVIGELGIDLSGGQRQRLSIARAILDDPRILLLDDPTSAIDPSTEAQIFEALDKAIRGRTTFIVAHRMSTLRRANKILLLERGSLVGFGTHEEMVRSSAMYREVISAQMGGRGDLREAAEVAVR